MDTTSTSTRSTRERKAKKAKKAKKVEASVEAVHEEHRWYDAGQALVGFAQGRDPLTIGLFDDLARCQPRDALLRAKVRCTVAGYAARMVLARRAVAPARYPFDRDCDDAMEAALLEYPEPDPCPDTVPSAHEDHLWETLVAPEIHRVYNWLSSHRHYLETITDELAARESEMLSEQWALTDGEVARILATLPPSFMTFETA